MVCDLQETECRWYWLRSGWHGDAALGRDRISLQDTATPAHSRRSRRLTLWQAEAFTQKVSMLWKPAHRSSLGGSNLLVFIRICLVLSQPMVDLEIYFLNKEQPMGCIRNLVTPAHHIANQNYSSTDVFLFLSLHLPHISHPQALKPPLSQSIYVYIHL